MGEPVVHDRRGVHHAPAHLDASRGGLRREIGDEEAVADLSELGDLVARNALARRSPRRHFAFGACEVMKSENDRLHLRLGKNGAIKEIASFQCVQELGHR